MSMRTTILNHAVDFEGWRQAARCLVLSGIPPERTLWAIEEASDLFAEHPQVASPAGTLNVPRALVPLAETTIQANDPSVSPCSIGCSGESMAARNICWTIWQTPLVQRITRLAQSVRRDTHKMRAFVRFREVSEKGTTRHVAWFEPEHYIVEANAAFFIRRFATMTWSILTPYRSAHWDGETLRLAAGATPADVPDDDRLEEYWRAYFSSIFNPARLKISAMTSEMPKKYWRNLPEAAAIPDLIRNARARTDDMVDQPNFSLERPAPRETRPAVQAGRILRTRLG